MKCVARTYIWFVGSSSSIVRALHICGASIPIRTNVVRLAVGALARRKRAHLGGRTDVFCAVGDVLDCWHSIAGWMQNRGANLFRHKPIECWSICMPSVCVSV